MQVVVVGGHSRKIGKTSVMVGIIRGLNSLAWTAVKITHAAHGICSRDGDPSDCPRSAPAFVLTEEENRRGRGDTCRFLAAGAQRSLWLRVRQGQLAQALPSLFEALHSDDHVIIESNSILSFLKPAVYVVVLDSSRRDFKTSARQFLEQADALVPVGPRLNLRTWPDLNPQILASKRVFPVSARDHWNPELCQFVRQRLEGTEAEIQVADFAPSAPTKEQPWRH